jgi:small subunit ribosomal protein S4
MLLGSSGEEVEKEKKELVTRLNKLGILNTNSLEDILPLTVSDLFERRLQTILYRKGLANTIKQARQLIVHAHVLVGENIVDVPAYTVPRDEEGSIRVVEGIKVINIEQGKEGPEPTKG